MNRPQLIVTDLDGTLLELGGSAVSPFTREALAAAAEVGVPVMFATGRPRRWLSPLEGIATTLPWALLANGAVLYDLAADEVRWTAPIDATTCLDFAAATRELIPGAAFAVEFADHWGREPEYLADHRHDVGAVIAPLPELVARADFMKLLVQNLEWEPDRLAEAVHPLAGEAMNVTFASRVGMLEISSGGVSKGTSMARIAGELGVDRADVVAFGDMPNDLEMLKWAGRGYAMSSAHPTLLAADLPLAGHQHEDAVARRILELIELPAGPNWRPLSAETLAAKP